MDIMKIGKIRNKSQLKKYNINKPLYNGNYLFHYLIITNNIIGLKLCKYMVNRMDENDMNGFMLAAKEGRYKILYYLIKTYPEYIYNKNDMNMNFLHYLSPDTHDYISTISHNNIDWVYLFQTYSTDYTSPLDLLFKMGTYTNIIKIIKLFDIDYSIYMSQPSFFNLLVNSNLKPEQIIIIIDVIYRKNKMIFTFVDDMGYNISFPIVMMNNMKMVRYIVKKCGKYKKFEL